MKTRPLSRPRYVAALWRGWTEPLSLAPHFNFSGNTRKFNKDGATPKGAGTPTGATARRTDLRLAEAPCCDHSEPRLHRIKTHGNRPISRREFDHAFEATSDPIDRARRAIVRCYMAFHHSALFNARRCTFSDARHISSNSVKSAEWSSYPRALVAVCRRLRGVIIEHSDAARVIRVQDCPDTLFFVDPPYLPSVRGSGKYRCELTEAHHIELLSLLRSLQGRVMISGYPSDLYDDLLHDWQRITRNHYAATPGGPGARTEALWISPEKYRPEIKQN